MLIEESVLRNVIGGADVMAGQLGHLITVASLPSVSLGIIPMGLTVMPSGRSRTSGSSTTGRSTVEQCLKDWLETLNTQAESTVTGYRIMVRHLVELLGSVKLVELRCGTSTSRLASWLSGCRPGTLGWPG